VAFPVGHGLAKDTNGHKQKDGTPGGVGRKGGHEQVWVIRSDPHDETDDQKVHVGEPAELVFDVNRNKVEKVVLGRDQRIVAPGVVGHSRLEEAIAPIFLLDLDNALASHGEIEAGNQWINQWINQSKDWYE